MGEGEGDGVAEVTAEFDGAWEFDGAEEFDGTEVTLLPEHAATTTATASPMATDRMVMNAAVGPGRRNGG